MSPRFIITSITFCGYKVVSIFQACLESHCHYGRVAWTNPLRITKNTNKNDHKKIIDNARKGVVFVSLGSDAVDLYLRVDLGRELLPLLVLGKKHFPFRTNSPS